MRRGRRARAFDRRVSLRGRRRDRGPALERDPHERVLACAFVGRRRRFRCRSLVGSAQAVRRRGPRVARSSRRAGTCARERGRDPDTGLRARGLRGSGAARSRAGRLADTSRGGSRRARGLHALADERVPRPFSRSHRQRPSVPPAAFPGRTSDRRRAFRGCRNDRRDRALRRSRHRFRQRDPPGTRPSRAARDALATNPRRGTPPAAGSREGAVRALLSCYDKRGLQEFARGLAELGWELVASGGTADFLEQEVGLDVERVEDLTGVAAMVGGRVKTLHPTIHAAILARRDRGDDLAALEEHEIRPFDLVCVNLYPFTEVAGRFGVREEEAVEMIDVGGPSMLRGAAKNFAHVAPVCRPEQYGVVLAELRERGDLPFPTRRALAAEAFATTAAYETAIARWFGDIEALPDRLTLSFTKAADLRYGENPHQRAAFYAEAGACVPP